MTESQRLNFYFPAWNRLWKTLKVLTLEQMEERFRSAHGPACELGLKVITVARQIANSQVTAEELRHACNVVATAGGSGSPKASCKGMNHGEVQRVVALFDLLAEPDSIKASMAWGDPDDASKRGLIAVIQKAAPEGLLAHIFLNAFDSREWKSGTKQQLVWLLKQVKGRKRTQRAQKEEVPEDMVPF